jgi:KipI family sensor histidine kinase inhibitor
MNIKPISTNSLMLYFGDTISSEISSKVQKAYQFITNLNDSAFIEIIPSYTTIFISYDIFKYDYEQLEKKLLTEIDLTKNLIYDDELINIDVYYGVEVGLDLENISQQKKLPIEEIIYLHSNKIYDVYAIGFLPGFGFLANVDDKIATPRLATPRKKVLKGSVAIADKQTAVYPKDSAGGWNIIGKTTKKLFDISNKFLSPLGVGKKVKFNPITKNKFINFGGQI